jgi:hypothetical protein
VLCPLWLELVVRESTHEGRSKVLRWVLTLLGWSSGCTYERLVKELFTLSMSQMTTIPLVV